MKNIFLISFIAVLSISCASGNDYGAVWEFKNAGFPMGPEEFALRTNGDAVLIGIVARAKETVKAHLLPDKSAGLEKIIGYLGKSGTNDLKGFLGALELLYFYNSPEEDTRLLGFFLENPDLFILSLNSKDWLANRAYPMKWKELLLSNKNRIAGDTEGYIYFRYKMLISGEFPHLPPALVLLTNW
ncbi:MAG: hypothetical protein A2Y33_03290 [Spirochaetes bacterium GWF1_51_8]|nr:MAG: hypothetical protein A2Y33_03290 [Spirochaetes bacterium GWF1_51_8]